MQNNSALLMMALLGLCLLLAGCAAIPSAAAGQTVFTMADKAANMGAITSILLTVDRVDVQSDTGNWVGVSSTAKTYDLIALRNSGAQALLASTQLPDGTYNQIRLSISNVLVTDASGQHTAKLPSGELRLVGSFTSNSSSNNSSVVSLDFLADHSLHIAENGQYILAPVVHLQTRENAQVDTGDGSNISVRGGQLRSDAQEGMDENGNVNPGVGINGDANLTIDDAGIIHVGTGSQTAANANVPDNGRLVATIGDPAVNLSGISRILVTVDSVQVHSSGAGWIILNSTPQTFDLLALNATSSTALLADLNLTPGAYDQIWLNVSNVTVTDSNGTHDALLPSHTLRFDLDTQVSANQTSVLAINFSASDSLHLTDSGVYILLPVVHVESWDNAQVDERDHARVRVSGGSERSRSDMGMDENGTVGANVHIPSDANISIVGDRFVIHPNLDMGVSGEINLTDYNQIHGNVSVNGSNNAPLTIGDSSSVNNSDISMRIRSGTG